jgi:hypothetical protein
MTIQLSPNFAMDDYGMYAMRGNFAVPVLDVAKARAGIGWWPVRAAVECPWVDYDEIEAAFRQAIRRNGFPRKIEWSTTRIKMAIERRKAIKSRG